MKQDEHPIGFVLRRVGGLGRALILAARKGGVHAHRLPHASNGRMMSMVVVRMSELEK